MRRARAEFQHSGLQKLQRTRDELVEEILLLNSRGEASDNAKARLLEVEEEIVRNRSKPHLFQFPLAIADFNTETQT